MILGSCHLLNVRGLEQMQELMYQLHLHGLVAVVLLFLVLQILLDPLVL